MLKIPKGEHQVLQASHLNINLNLFCCSGYLRMVFVYIIYMPTLQTLYIILYWYHFYLNCNQEYIPLDQQ